MSEQVHAGLESTSEVGGLRSVYGAWKFSSSQLPASYINTFWHVLPRRARQVLRDHAENVALYGVDEEVTAGKHVEGKEEVWLTIAIRFGDGPTEFITVTIGPAFESHD